MTEEKRYKILELITTGWNLIDSQSCNLTKEECDIKLNEFVTNGQNPDSLKAVQQDDPRFPTEEPKIGYIPQDY